jgi:hypothetical protein
MNRLPHRTLLLWEPRFCGSTEVRREADLAPAYFFAAMISLK